MVVLIFLHTVGHTLFKYFMSISSSAFSPWLLCSELTVSLSVPLLHHFWGNQSHPDLSDTHFNTLCPARLLCPLIRFDSANWISLWNKHPFMHMSIHTNTHELDTETLLSWLFARWLLFSAKAANRSKLLPTTWKYQVPDCSAVMELTADQSNYGPARASVEPGERRMGWREGCVSLRGRGSGGYLAPGPLTVTVWL